MPCCALLLVGLQRSTTLSHLAELCHACGRCAVLPCDGGRGSFRETSRALQRISSDNNSSSSCTDAERPNPNGSHASSLCHRQKQPADVLRAWTATQKAVPQIAMAAASSRWPKNLTVTCDHSLGALMLDVAAAWRAAHPSPRAAIIAPSPSIKQRPMKQGAWEVSAASSTEPVTGGRALAHLAPQDAWKVLVKRPRGALPFAPRQHHRRPLLSTSQPLSYSREDPWFQEGSCLDETAYRFAAEAISSHDRVVDGLTAGSQLQEQHALEEVRVPGQKMAEGSVAGAGEDDYTELEMEYPDVKYSLVEPRSRAAGWAPLNPRECSGQVHAPCNCLWHADAHAPCSCRETLS